jgi:hypothetical protein
MVGIDSFLEENAAIEFLEVISYPPLPPRCVRMVGSAGSSIHLTTEMHDFADRTEIGEIRILSDWSKGDEATERRERLPGGRVVGLKFLRLPGVELVSGVRLIFDKGELIVLAGDAPYSVYVRRDAVEIGRPEYHLEKYQSQ